MINNEINERDRLLWMEHARQADQAEALKKRVAVLLSRRRAKGARWKSATDVAHLAAGGGAPVEPADLSRELRRLMHTIRLGEVFTRKERAAVMLTGMGMPPYRMTAAQAEREMAMWGDDLAVELFMHQALLPEWAWRLYVAMAPPSQDRDHAIRAFRVYSHS